MTRTLLSLLTLLSVAATSESVLGQTQSSKQALPAFTATDATGKRLSSIVVDTAAPTRAGPLRVTPDTSVLYDGIRGPVRSTTVRQMKLSDKTGKTVETLADTKEILFDREGRIVSYTVKTPDGTIDSKVTKTFAGNFLKRVNYFFNYSSGAERITTLSEYDKNGNLTSTTSREAKGNVTEVVNFHATPNGYKITYLKQGRPADVGYILQDKAARTLRSELRTAGQVTTTELSYDGPFLTRIVSDGEKGPRVETTYKAGRTVRITSTPRTKDQTYSAKVVAYADFDARGNPRRAGDFEELNVSGKTKYRAISRSYATYSYY
ncbi:hypothetical protein [Deinococcus altitudinis]|uniref:hypothetical protein n=1 Tax=Deinococcus altitudinis TaxID=468914 RepID=UPI003891B1A7